MRLTTIRTRGGTRAARVDGDRLVELPEPDVGAVLAGGPTALRDAATAPGPERDTTGADYAPVVPNPSKIICLGLNYERHIARWATTPPTSRRCSPSTRRRSSGPATRSCSRSCPTSSTGKPSWRS